MKNKTVESLAAPEDMRRSLGEFFDRTSIGLEAGPRGAVSVRRGTAGGREPCGPSLLVTGGWIACPVALGMARKLSIPARDMGRLLNHLNVKIRECGLGCF